MTNFTTDGAVIQHDSISVGGTYALTASGAQGGSTQGYSGGLGASVSGDIYLAAGTVLEIIVGVDPTPAPIIGGGGGGGGGGSFVFETLSSGKLDPVIIAGGGGGAGYNATGLGGQAGPTGGNGAGANGGAGGKTGQPGDGGFSGGGGGYTGGDGGFLGMGGNGSDNAVGFTGGTAQTTSGSGKFADGGFGGGGGGGFLDGGGGGGYGGGGGGGSANQLGNSAGGGGGSYDSDLKGAIATGTLHAGNGVVTVELVHPGLCYLRGTRILTPTGEVAVEELRVGERIVTRFGGVRRIKWIGRQIFAADEAPETPVHIHAGALGEHMPARGLFVSPGHSMLIEDRLILAHRLVNGVTITREPVATAWIEYFNLDLGAHDCVIAEGAWSETYADAPGARAAFHNAASFASRYPNERPAAELTLCAERPEAGPRFNEILRPIAARAAAATTPGRLEGFLERVEDGWNVIGWARDADHPELPVVLEVCAGNAVLGTVLACDHRADLTAAGKGTGHCAFNFPSPVRITSEVQASLTIRRAVDQVAIPAASGIPPAAAETRPAPVPKLRLVV